MFYEVFSTSNYKFSIFAQFCDKKVLQAFLVFQLLFQSHTHTPSTTINLNNFPRSIVQNVYIKKKL